MKYRLNIIASGLACIAFPASILPAGAQSALPAPVDAFVVSANSLAKAAAERADLGRATARLNQIRQEVTDKLLAARTGDPIRLTIVHETLLCEPRAANVEVAVRRNYIQTVAANFQQVGRPSRIDNLSSAISSLFASQSLDIRAEIPSASELEDAKKKVRDRCQTDVKSFDRAYYGRNLTSPAPPAPRDVIGLEAVPVFGAIGALIDTIVSVITPVVVEGAKMVDEERRRQAVLGFLSDPAQVKRIQDSGLALATEVSAFTWDKRLKLAGAFIERTAILRASAIDPSRNESCKRYMAAGKPTDEAGTSVTDHFILCWRFVWEQIEPDVGATLKAAEDYDGIADAGDTDNAYNAFKPLGESLAAVSTTNEGDIRKFWNWATRLLAFAQKLESGHNENRQKVQKSIDDLVKAF